MSVNTLRRQTAAVTALASLIAAQRAAGMEPISWRISRWNKYLPELTGQLDPSGPLSQRLRALADMTDIIDATTEPALTVYREEAGGGDLTVTSGWGGTRIEICMHLSPADVVELRVPDGLELPGGEA